MFTDNKNFEQVAEQVWVWRNFVTEEENNQIMSIMKEYESRFADNQDAFKFEDQAIDWYKNKTGPLESIFIKIDTIKKLKFKITS